MTGKKVATFRERITELVDSSPKSRTVIANEFGVAKQTLSAWLTGQNSPRLPVVVALAEYFGVSLEWLNGFDVPKYEIRSVVPEPAKEESASDDEIRILIPGSSKLSPEQHKRLENAFRAVFLASFPELSEGDDDK